ncbi:MAG TPA: pitrilysin family protein [Deltaproteobacteria bacterium]|nr:pitrilysin family protein [Deltaproteobacteria bacterium]
MTRLILAIVLLVCTCVPVLAGGAVKTDPRTMAFPELKFQIPQVERKLLDCGMPVYLLRDAELPLVSITAMVRTGSVYEPSGKAGLAGLTGQVMRSGGAGGMSPEKMDDELEFMASSVESSIGSDMGMVSMSSLSRNLQQTLNIFASVLLKPDFSEKRVEMTRKQMIEALRRQNDDPKDIAGREIGKAIYCDHPLGVVPDFASAAAITRSDMMAFHRRFYQPGNMILAVAGDFDPSDMLKRLNRIFGKSPAPRPELPHVAQPSENSVPEVLLVKKEVGQSVIRMGHLGLTKDNPDQYAVRVLDYMLGGSFTSRLMMEIRTNRGLAYHVGSHFDIGRRFTGSFVVETETKPQSTLETVRLMKGIMSELQKAPVSEQELNTARNYMINSFIFGFTNPAAVATQRARLEFYGYPADYLEKYRERIAAVTRDDVLAAARKYLRPGAFRIVVVGDPARFDAPLSELGTVRVLKLDNGG